MTTYYRTHRGGVVPLGARERRDLLELYSDHARPVREIAEIFGVSTSTVYRWLPLLGVRALAEREVVSISRRRRKEPAA